MSNATDEGSEERLDERLSAVERAVTASDATVADLGDGAAAAAEREALESRVADLESRVEELEAATQAIRGYAGAIRAVNREVERRADLALARASRDGDASESGSQSETGRVGADADNAVPRDEVPDDAALDAAVPGDAAERGDWGGAADGDAAEADGDADGSWRDEALDRLRESL